ALPIFAQKGECFASARCLFLDGLFLGDALFLYCCQGEYSGRSSSRAGRVPSGGSVPKTRGFRTFFFVLFFFVVFFFVVFFFVIFFFFAICVLLVKKRGETSPPQNNDEIVTPAECQPRTASVDSGRAW